MVFVVLIMRASKGVWARAMGKAVSRLRMYSCQIACVYNITCMYKGSLLTLSCSAFELECEGDLCILFLSASSVLYRPCQRFRPNPHQFWAGRGKPPQESNTCLQSTKAPSAVRVAPLAPNGPRSCWFRMHPRALKITFCIGSFLTLLASAFAVCSNSRCGQPRSQFPPEGGAPGQASHTVIATY